MARLHRVSIVEPTSFELNFNEADVFSLETLDSFSMREACVSLE